MLLHELAHLAAQRVKIEAFRCQDDRVADLNRAQRVARFQVQCVAQRLGQSGGSTREGRFRSVYLPSRHPVTWRHRAAFEPRVAGEDDIEDAGQFAARRWR